MKLNSTEELIKDFASGKMVILMDDEDRENEGDIVVAAEKISPEIVNFMATHARGLICLALTEERCKLLELDSMVLENESQHGTAFTTSIEAAQGVTTGISAADRATTIRAAVNPNATAQDIVQPGHIFPIKASPGGVLSRAGHTEAGPDLAKLAGLDPAAVIVEIMNEDGSMARRADLEKFAIKHNLKLGTIADLIHYRNTHEKSVIQSETTEVETDFGRFRLFIYKDIIFDKTHLALTLGEIKPEDEVLVRIQQTNTLHDIMNINGFGNRWSFTKAMEKIQREGKGALILLSNQESQSEIINNTLFLKGKKRNNSMEAPDSRNIGLGAQILRDIGIQKIKLLGAKVKYPLTGFDLEITQFINFKK
ncbi:MAG: 3,4-dihydroxy-2-butanone-4-phosphate synthase [SAR86 cluster bacterium]|nr:3,4-dihydroxy-2-butanone-4-phosphate synthase [SAR86 cluster bacterium]